MFTALVLVCAGGILNPDECYYLTSPGFYETQQECAKDVYQEIKDNRELIEFFDESINAQWRITKVRCINWKAIEV